MDVFVLYRNDNGAGSGWVFFGLLQWMYLSYIGITMGRVRDGSPPFQPCPVYLKQFSFPSYLKN